MVSADYIQQGLVQRGLPAHIAQGFVMNMRDESGLNPGINERTPLVQGSRGGYGLYQLTGPRRRAYESYASNRGVSFENADAQLDFLMAELQGPEKRAAQSIFSTNNPQDAAVAIARDFLRPAASNLQKRVASYTGGSSPKATTGTQGAAPMMQQEQKPRGLLGSLGIQKMEEGAEGETGQRFYQRDSFKDTAAVLAQGFGRMGIMGMEEIADGVAKQRTEKKAQNKTIEMLGKMGTPQAMSAIEYIKAGGAATDALKIAFAKPEKVTPYTDAAKLKADLDRGLISPETYEAEAQRLAQGKQPDTPAEIRTLKYRAEAAGLVPGTPEFKKFMLAGGGGESGSGPAAYEVLRLRARDSGLVPGTPEFQQFMLTGGTGDTVASQEESAEAKRLNQEQEDLAFFAAGERVLDRMKEPGLVATTGVVADFVKDTPFGQRQLDVAEDLAMMEAQMQFKTLANLKASSPNGSSGLGQLTEAERKALGKLYANFSNRQGEDAVARTIKSSMLLRAYFKNGLYDSTLPTPGQRNATPEELEQMVNGVNPFEGSGGVQLKGVRSFNTAPPASGGTQKTRTGTSQLSAEDQELVNKYLNQPKEGG